MILYQDRSYDTRLCASRLSLFVVQDRGPMILQKCSKLGFWAKKFGSKPVASKTWFLISFRVLGCKKTGFSALEIRISYYTQVFVLLKTGYPVISKLVFGTGPRTGPRSFSTKKSQDRSSKKARTVTSLVVTVITN